MAVVNKFNFLRCKKNEEKFLNEFLKDMRKADIEEISALRNDIHKELEESLMNSSVAIKVLSPDDKPLCIYGVTEIKGVEGYLIWCVGTNELMKYKKSFVKMSKHILGNWKKQYGIMYNCVSVDNKKAIAWLKYLGATFSEPFPVGEDDKYFMKFVL